ncbi:STAS domain-containing protein [Nonomuraea sp. NPDC049421]|uniref:STAS domain-containing protein n=1 Tax=Nonomuraea sp. NPDC049421 TaxID=3155275 RepID=UPI00343BBA21
MMHLSVRLVPVDGHTLVVALTGELDHMSRPVLSSILDPVPRSPLMHVLVAAADLWFCDLNGLERLTLTHRALRAKGGHLAVAEARPPLRRLIALMGEQADIPVHATMAEALAAAQVDAYRLPAPARRHLPSLRGIQPTPRHAR